MIDMGALQPGLPSPVAVPKGWEIIVIDLQDCFFTIKLYPKDYKRFAFSVPFVDKALSWPISPGNLYKSFSLILLSNLLNLV